MKNLSNWRAARLRQSRLEQELHRSYDLRLHGWVIGAITLLLMWGVSALLLHAGVHSLAIRYLIALGVGYLGYLGLLRWWAQRLVERDARFNPDVPDIPDPWPGRDEFPSVYTEPINIDAGSAGAEQLDLAGGLDDGSVVVVPVLAVFLIGAALAAGLGALALLMLGWDVLLVVAVELAFSYASARTAVRLAREGWLSAAWRLTWKPLLGALLSAVLLGALVDFYVPEADTLPQAIRALRNR